MPIIYILQNVETINFDDFGAELCCVPEADISEFVLDTGNKFCFADKETNKELKRYKFLGF